MFSIETRPTICKQKKKKKTKKNKKTDSRRRNESGLVFFNEWYQKGMPSINGLVTKQIKLNMHTQNKTPVDNKKERKRREK